MSLNVHSLSELRKGDKKGNYDDHIKLILFHEQLGHQLAKINAFGIASIDIYFSL